MDYAKDNGIDVGPKRLESFKTYLLLLLEWNQKFNLTSITEPEDIWRKHFLDSLTVLVALPEDAKRVIDIGTGAGFPGLAIAIVRPDFDITLLEATGKKVKFLEHVIATLELKNVTAIHGRAEDAKGKYDAVLARAVAALPTLWEYAWPLLKEGGVLISQKKRGGSEEIDSKYITDVVPIDLPHLPARELVVIKKV